MPGSSRSSGAVYAVAHDGHASTRPTEAQLRWLTRGLDQAGGKLPMFDIEGQRVPERTIRACIVHGWAEKWFDNPLKRDWLVCRLTHLGRVVAEEGAHALPPPPPSLKKK